MTANPRVSPHISLNERLVFEQGSAGRRGYDLPALDVPATRVEALMDWQLLREEIPGMPELSEVDVIRHFTRLSTWNYHIDLGLYPLGSCTMKYNPKVNEMVSRLAGFQQAHPLSPPELVQGALHVQSLPRASGFVRDIWIERSGGMALVPLPETGRATEAIDCTPSACLVTQVDVARAVLLRGDPPWPWCGRVAVMISALPRSSAPS